MKFPEDDDSSGDNDDYDHDADNEEGWTNQVPLRMTIVMIMVMMMMVFKQPGRQARGGRVRWWWLTPSMGLDLKTPLKPRTAELFLSCLYFGEGEMLSRAGEQPRVES